MVAYGVLEMKHKSVAQAWLDNYSKEEQDKLRQEDFERDQLRKLVKDELRRYGLLMERTVVPKGDRYRTRLNAHVLYGQLEGGGMTARRAELVTGSFKECCEVAAKLLDEMDAAQVPDTKTSPDL
jgi:hypothetical protein